MIYLKWMVFWDSFIFENSQILILFSFWLKINNVYLDESKPSTFWMFFIVVIRASNTTVDTDYVLRCMNELIQKFHVLFDHPIWISTEIYLSWTWTPSTYKKSFYEGLLCIFTLALIYKAKHQLKKKQKSKENKTSFKVLNF